MRVCFYTLGCKVNLNETGALEQLFRANGFTIAQEGEAADVFIVNSCTVTNFGDQKSRKWLRRKKRENPGAVTVLTGCYPQAFPEEAAQFMLIMMHEGHIIYDVAGEEKQKLHVSDLLAKFQIASGGEFANDRMILSN